MSKVYSSLGNEVENKEFNLFLSITSISAAFLAIVLPLTSNSGTFFRSATYTFLIEVLLGVGFMLLNIIYSKRGISHDSKWVDGKYKKLIKESSRLLSKAQIGTITQNDLDEYWTIRDELSTGIDKINKDRVNSLPGKILHYSWIFYVIFVLSIILLLANVIQPQAQKQPNQSLILSTTTTPR